MNFPLAHKTLIKPGYLIVSREPTVIYAVLGNAVMVTMHDVRLRYGGAVHFIYPRTENASNATVEYGNVSILSIYNSMIQFGSKKTDIVSKILGGSDKPGESVGKSNIEQAKKTLKRLGIKITKIDAGGHIGRKLVYFNQTDEIAIINSERIREYDWYPYKKGDGYD